MEYIIAAIVGYLFGCINPATVIAKIKKVDIRNIGSKNPGASNVFITVGIGYGVVVGICDILKSFLAAQMIFFLTGGNFGASVFAGAMAVIGHNYPFWLKFNGGKGFAPFLGLVFYYDWKLFLIFVVIIAAIILVVDYIAVATFSLTAFMPFYVFFTDELKIVTLAFLLVAVSIWIRHRQNMKNLINGTEIGFRGKNKFIKKEP